MIPLLKSTNVYDYAPIARGLCRIDEVAEAKIRKMFDIAYLKAKEDIAKWILSANWRKDMELILDEATKINWCVQFL